MPSAVIARRNRREILLDAVVALLLDAQLFRELGELLHRRLHLRQATLERADFRLQCSTRLIQLANLVRHLLELIESRVVELAVNLDRLELLVEMLEHTTIVLLQRTRAHRARALLTEVDDLVPLRVELSVLLAQRISFGLGFLTIAHPFSASRLEPTESLLELFALRLERNRRLFLHDRRVEDARPPFTEPSELVAQQALGFNERLATPFLAREPFEALELLRDVSERGKLRRKRLELRARGTHARELANHAVCLTRETSFLGFGDPQLGEQLLQLLALFLRALPPRR
ncbi:MAG TPA: hypothetical protein VJR89_00170 [Polyangiales bacterium]|nr:hypothetical protein [Polyangiales bacterium]